MSRWLKVHQALLAAALIFLAGQALLFMLVLQPRQAELRKTREEAADLQKRLARSPWPPQPERLAAVTSDLRQRLGDAGQGVGLAARAESAMARAARTFAPYVQRGYETRANLMRSVSLLDYQSEYSRVCRELSARGVHLSPAVLQLRDDTSSPFVYQLMLHIWAVEKVALLVQASGLRIAGDDAVKVQASGGLAVPAAAITAEPMLALVGSSSATQPYLLCFPVRVTAEGSLEQVLAFLASLDGPELFLPARGFELTRLPPKSLRGDSSGMLGNGDLRLEAECVAFFVMGGRG